MTNRQIDRRIASGAWTRLRRGSFAVGNGSAGPVALPVRASRLASARTALAAASMALRGRDVAVSHQSAAMLYGLPNPLAGWGFPTFSGDDGSVRLRTEAHVLVAPLAPLDLTRTPDGFTVTGLARTVADCARSLPPTDGLAIVDAALRRGLRKDDLLAVLKRQKGWPGIVQARRLAELGDGRRETALESWSAWAFDEWAVPRPAWQVEVYAQDGDFCGRVDCWWKAGLAGEADGRAKYVLQAAERGGVNAENLSLALDSERARERGLRRTRADVVRWGAAQTRGRAAGAMARDVITRLHEASLAGRFVGTVVVPALILPSTTPKPASLLS